MKGLPPLVSSLLPQEKQKLLSSILDHTVLGDAFWSQINRCCDHFYTYDFKACIENSKFLLDHTWEKLNTGHWKDVNINWRFAYSVLSLLKACSEMAHMLSFPGDMYWKKSQILKTCDMGLLMGAPIHDNILAKLSGRIQKHFEVQQEQNCEVKPIDAATKSVLNIDSVCKEPKEKKPKFSSEEWEKLEAGENGIMRCSCPSLEYFQQVFMDKKLPVIITDAMDFWPALSSRKWTMDYIRAVAGCRTVPVELGSKYTEESWSQTLMTIKEFIENHIERSAGHSEVGYLAQHRLFEQIPELEKDIVTPDYCVIGESEEVDINAWFGPRGTVSPLHYDPKHNFLAQVVGEKYLKLYSDTMTEYLYPHESKLLHNTSQVDIENPDTENFPLFQKAKCMECVLKSGEMLYIPKNYWHFVKSLSVSFSVSFWWE